MGQQVGTPRVQDGEESDLGTEPFRIGCDFEQGLGTGIKQQVEEWPGRSQCQRVQFVRQGEDNVELVGVDEVPLLGFEPSPAGLRLTLRAAA